MSEGDPEATVTYTVRELLGQIQDDVREVKGRLAAVEQAAASAKAVRVAVWSAIGSPVVAALVAWLIARG